jgi:DNA-binding Lrp family transcriptional regulator
MQEARNIKPIYIDRLDQRLIEVTNDEGSIELSVLSKEYPEFADVPSSSLWYRVNSLAQNGYIRVERQRRSLVLHSVEL